MVSADIEADELFALFRPLARSAGYRAVQLIPIMSRRGALLGTLAHFHVGRKPAEHDLRLFDLYVRQAADIIERHKAEDALRENEELLRLVRLRTGIGFWDWDLRTGEVTCTPQLEALFGLKPGSVKCYADFRKPVHPDDIVALEATRDGTRLPTSLGDAAIVANSVHVLDLVRERDLAITVANCASGQPAHPQHGDGRHNRPSFFHLQSK
jgi:PAS domain-containing protein